MHRLHSLTQQRRVGPSEISSADREDVDVDDLTPTEDQNNYRRRIALEAAISGNKQRQIFFALLLGGVAVLAIGIATFFAVTVSQKMTDSFNNENISCSPNCMNSGTCVSNNVCQCPTGYNGSYCAMPICNQSCVNGNCAAPNICTCVAGYNGATCAAPICTLTCINGACSAPNTCTCQPGWSGTTCNTPICAPPCVNGACSSQNNCSCNSGWNGSTCNSPICTPLCLNSGNCIAPNTCNCPTGYNGSVCQYPICGSSCLNSGTCTGPNTCACTPQYNGSTCATPICTSACQNNGNCSAPNTCTCATGYNGALCQNPICNPFCINGGTCSAPNTCQCIPDVWTGPYCQTPLRILWAFDNNLNDFYSNYQGTGINGPTYSSPGINGYGSCLSLTASSNQSVTIVSPPFLNMALTSFSLVAWVKATTFNNGTGGRTDNALFGQNENKTLDRSLHIVVRNQKIYLGFFGDDTSGNITLYPGIWYHMGYIYDYPNRTQYVYVNGVLDASGSPKGPYLGASGNLTIGTNDVGYPYNHWDGCIDQVAYFARAKSATEVIRDATLTIQYTFDNTLLDSGPLGINGTGANYSYASAGRINQSLALFGNRSYVQAASLVLLGTTGQSYSFSIWIKPTVTTQGTLIYVTGIPSGASWCIPMLGFNTSGSIIAHSWSPGSVNIVGPVPTVNVWTHITTTYSASVGLRLWINGAQYGSASGAFTYTAANVPVTVTLGQSFNGTGYCNTGGINVGQYYGYLDEFKLYSRELSASDIFALANP